jgi:hypothetical protein
MGEFMERKRHYCTCFRILNLNMVKNLGKSRSFYVGNVSVLRKIAVLQAGEKCL